MPEFFASPLKIAEVCHNVNKAFCEGIGDNSQPTWADAPEWQIASAVQGVMNILNGEVNTPEESHEGWLAQKQADGWVYGPEKDPELKTHPCIKPYALLPNEQRIKDHLFFAIVRSLA